jgi:hypothetical protein
MRKDGGPAGDGDQREVRRADRRLKKTWRASEMIAFKR